MGHGRVTTMCGSWVYDWGGHLRHCVLCGGHDGKHKSYSYPYHLEWEGVGSTAFVNFPVPTTELRPDGRSDVAKE